MDNAREKELVKEIERLKTKIRQLEQENANLRANINRQYRYDQDYLPWQEEDR
jgi:cell division protein FtsB